MVGRRSADDRPISRPISYLISPFSSADVSADRRPIIGRSSLDSKVIGRSSADDRPIVQFCDFLSKSVRIVFNVIASVGRQIDVYRPIKIQKSYRPTVFFNVISALAYNKICLFDIWYHIWISPFSSADVSADRRPIIGRSSLDSKVISRRSADRRPTIGRLYSFVTF